MADDASTLNRVSSEAVEKATGRGWSAWLEALDAAGAADWDHKTIVAHLERAHPEVGSWWRQTLAVGYEKARGKRVVGETADAGFQVGVQRSVAADASEVWDVLTTRPDLWLGDGATVRFAKGETYDVPASADQPAGATGEVRSVRDGERVRLTWHPGDWPAPATLQLTLTPRSSGKTAIQAHVERLPDGEAREVMRDHWRRVLDRLVAAVTSGAG